MPYLHKFTQHFTARVQQLSELDRQALLTALRKILLLQDPRHLGGLYLKTLWAYPYAPGSIIICRIDDAGSELIFCDLCSL